MNMKKISCFIMSVLFVLSIPTICYAEDNTKNDNIKAKSVVLMSIDTGEVLLKKNEYEHLSPASVTKIMSILLVMEALDNDEISLTDTVTASANAEKMGGSQIWLEVGEQMSVDDLLKAVIVASANDACTALGEYVAGSSTAFVKMMNERATELGLKNTNFENCTGLDDTTENHYSCAYDLAVISCEVMKYDLVRNYTTIWLDSLRNGETELNNTNKLVNTYDGITGLKTGTTSNAGFCISATAERDGMNLVAVVLGSDTSENRFSTATYLLDYGFSEYKILKPEFDKNEITEVKVINGIEKSIVPVINDNCSVLVENSNKEYKYVYEISKSIQAPVKKGTVIGKVKIYDSNKIVATVKLVSPRTVRKITLKQIFDMLLINI